MITTKTTKDEGRVLHNVNVKVLAKAIVGEAALAQGAWKEVRYEIAKAGQQRARGLTARRQIAGWRARQVPAAVASKAQTKTSTQTAVRTTIWTQTYGNNHSSEKIGDSPTPNPKAEDTRHPRLCADDWIQFGGETPNFKDKSHCTSAQQDGRGNCVSN